MALIPDAWLKNANSIASVIGNECFEVKSGDGEFPLPGVELSFMVCKSFSAVAGFIFLRTSRASSNKLLLTISHRGLSGTKSTKIMNNTAGKAWTPNIHRHELSPMSCKR